MPSSFAGGPIHCSDITLRCMRGRVKSKKSKTFLENVELGSDPLVKASGAGHILGSNMFMLDAGQKVLYTGDFCPQDRLDIEGARPQKCDILIVEATYGNPRYKFPDRREMIKVIHDWVEDVLHQDTRPCCTPILWASHRSSSPCSGTSSPACMVPCSIPHA